MVDLIADGTAVTLILLLVAAEALVLAAYRWWSKSGPRLRDIVFNLAAGACLLLALRSALTGESGSWIALWLTAALGAHAADLAARWRR